jgi:predicted DNA-binding ribbon-helix-helix protein
MMKKKEVMLRSLIDDIDEEVHELKNCLRSVRNTCHTSFMLKADDEFCDHLDQTVEVLAKRIGLLEENRAKAYRELESAFYARIKS